MLPSSIGIADLKEICELNKTLKRENLVAWTSGNVSGRFGEYIVVKPSGVLYDELRPARMSVVRVSDGEWLFGAKPSVDTESHLYIYRNRPDVGGVVHTHSTYATAFAAANRGIPCVLTAAADEFGGAIPCGRYAAVGGDGIGKAIVDGIGSGCAILLPHHGVFTVGVDALAAVKAAVMVEDAARTTWVALHLGDISDLPGDEIDKLHRRYRDRYGQPDHSPGNP